MSNDPHSPTNNQLDGRHTTDAPHQNIQLAHQAQVPQPDRTFDDCHDCQKDRQVALADNGGTPPGQKQGNGAAQADDKGGKQHETTVKCPGPKFIGTGTAHVDKLVIAPGITGDVEAAKQAAINESIMKAYRDAQTRVAKKPKPNCTPCVPVLTVIVTPGSPTEYQKPKAPGSVPEHLKELVEKAADQLYTIIQVDTKWEAWWVCKVSAEPTDPGGNGADGSPSGTGPQVFSGGESTPLPCPHPFASGAVTLDKTFRESDYNGKAQYTAAIDKAIVDFTEEVKAKIAEAIASLDECPPRCPQAGPISIQVEPFNVERTVQENTNSGDITTVKCTVHWSVERSCKAS